ncbi:MAG: ABC transporter substrate-binding protein [Prevotella sp.]|nr:ABC transporter substrate-binding protein [Candidatus Prevotella equi]
MRRQHIFHFPFSIFHLFFLLFSCTGTKTDLSDSGMPIAMRYADFLSLSESDGIVTATITNPWDTTRILHRYVLVPSDQDLLAQLPEGDVIRTPLQRSVVYTSVHCSLVNQLGAYKGIAGVCDADYIYLDKIQRDVKAGLMRNIGNSMSPDMEQLIDLSPDAILLSPFENSGSYGKLGKMGIPLIECADYMETSPLGRAEWMRFYGLLYGRRHEADSIFATIEKEYNSLKALAAKEKAKPSIVADTKVGATWYIAGANSTMGRLYADAGGAYLFADEPSNGAVPYDPEVAFDKAQQADLWLIKYNQATDMTKEQLAQAWPNNARMKAFKDNNIYACNLTASLFYEETPFHPELLLKELIHIFHPHLLPDYKARYFFQIENLKNK